MCNSLSSQPLLGIVRKDFLLGAPSLWLSCKEHFDVQVLPKSAAWLSPLELLSECDVTQGCKGISLIIRPGMLGEHKDGFPRQQLMSLGESTEAERGVCEEQESI